MTSFPAVPGLARPGEARPGDPGSSSAPPPPVPQPPAPVQLNKARRPFYARRGAGRLQAGVPVTAGALPLTRPAEANYARRPFWPRKGTGHVQPGAPFVPAIPQPAQPAQPNKVRRPFWPRRGVPSIQRGTFAAPVPAAPYPARANYARRLFYPRRGVPLVLAGSPWQAPTASVNVVGSNSFAITSGFFFPFPAARPLQIPVAGAAAGDWLFAVVTWRQAAAGAGVTVSVADDVHNYWEPLGAPSGDSPAAGVTRTAIWYAPAARVPAFVQVAPTGFVVSIAAEILDVSNLPKWVSVTAVTPGEANAATALSLAIGAPASTAFMLAALGTDLNTATIGGPGAGWNGLAPVTASNGVDHTADLTLSSAWQEASGGKTAAWTSTATLDLSGVTAGVLVTVAAPAQPNPAWPVVVTELAPGAGAATPPSQIAWTPLSARALAMSITQGRQYTLGQLQAGQGSMVIDNPDGALIPPGTGSFAGIDSGTPVRQRLIWPASPTPYYVPFSGFFQRWPFNLEADMLRGQAQATIQDVWAYAAGTLDSMAREESLLDGPYALWPLDDPAGSTSGTNLAPGNTNPLVLTVSKYGANGGTATFGNSGGLTIGDSSAQITSSGTPGGQSGMFTQVLGQPPGDFFTGYALVCQDTGYPPISAGVTVEAWSGVTPNGALAGFVATAATGLFAAAGTWTNGQPVVLSVATGFTFPGGFSTSTVYYVVNSSSGNFQLAATLGGSALTVTSDGEGFIQPLATGWNPELWSVRGIKGLILGFGVEVLTGHLFMQYQTAAGATSTVTIDSTNDYRSGTDLRHIAVAFNQASYLVLVNGGSLATVSGSFSAALPAAFTEFSMAGVADRTLTGSFMPGNLAFAGIWPAVLPQARIVSHYWAGGFGMTDEDAEARIERILEYASLTGRRCILQQPIQYELDEVASGKDIGGQPAASSVGNVAASTVPAMAYVAPTGDIFYRAKAWTWNQAIRWTLGDAVAAGEIPFLPDSFATDYDPSRVVNAIQLTQLDTGAVTLPAGATASTTMGAIEAGSKAQYGDQPYQQTGYLLSDSTSPYTNGSSLADLADWLASVYAKPANRVQSVTVEASASAANAAVTSGLAWQFWAGASIGDMVRVNLRLPTAATSPLVSLVARITQTQRDMQFSQGGVTAKIAATLDFAPEYNALTCDDPVRGLLNGQNCLGW